MDEDGSSVASCMHVCVFTIRCKILFGEEACLAATFMRTVSRIVERRRQHHVIYLCSFFSFPLVRIPEQFTRQKKENNRKRHKPSFAKKKKPISRRRCPSVSRVTSWMHFFCHWMPALCVVRAMAQYLTAVKDVAILSYLHTSYFCLFFVVPCLRPASQSAQGSSRVPWIFPHAWTVVGTGNPPIAVQYSCMPNASGSVRKLLLLQTAQSKTNYSFSTVSRIYVLACNIGYMLI